MNLVNQKVKHLTFGTGTVVKQKNGYVTVQFTSKTSDFVYPNAFENFLKIEDISVRTSILREIETAKVAAEEKKNAETAARIEASKKVESKKPMRQTSISKKNREKLKTAATAQRIPGKRMTFFVFQGATFDKEHCGGYIWAPKFNKNGHTFHHWNRLLDVRPGDIILHGCNGCIKAISTAKAVCYECKQPAALTVENLWENEGRRVDCDYTIIDKPIKTSEFIDDILRLCNIKYAPFSKTGKGNVGYLYDINRELAHIFVNASVKQNTYLKAEEYIQELLSEVNNG